MTGKFTPTKVNSASIGNSSAGATAYTAAIPAGTGIKAGDTIIVNGAGNGTHVTNGMIAKVGAITMPVMLETRQGSLSSHYMQSFRYKTPVDIADGTLITFTPYAASTANSFTAVIYRGLKGTVSVAAAGQSNAAANVQPAPALASPPPAGDLVLTFDATT